MNILSYALDNAKRRIPRQLLNECYRKKTFGWRRCPVSVDNFIMEHIIRAKVLVDANIVGGSIVNINVENVSPVYSDQNSLVYKIPSEAVNNRTIMSVLSISYMPYASTALGHGFVSGNVLFGRNQELATAAMRVMGSYSNIPAISNANAQLIGHNTIMFNDTNRITNNYIIRAILMNEENLNNISPRSYAAFAQLCLYAIKATLHTELVIDVDEAFLSGGQVLGSFSQELEKYADMWDMYDAYLKEKWMKIAFMNDSQSYGRYIKAQISPGL